MNADEKEKNLNALNNFVGYGNPNSNIWFMGLDEFGHSEEDKDSLKRLLIYRKNFERFSEPYYLTNEDFEAFKEIDIPAAKKSPTNNRYAELFYLKTNCHIKNEDIGSKNSDLFICNIFSLARPNQNSDFNQFIKSNIFEGNFSTWEKNCWDTRLDILKKFMKRYFLKGNNKTIFCFGFGNWFKFEQILQPFENVCTCQLYELSHKKVRCYKFYKLGANDIYLVDHPSNGWLKSEHLKEIISKNKK